MSENSSQVPACGADERGPFAASSAVRWTAAQRKVTDWVGGAFGQNHKALGVYVHVMTDGAIGYRVQDFLIALGESHALSFTAIKDADVCLRFERLVIAHYLEWPRSIIDKLQELLVAAVRMRGEK